MIKVGEAWPTKEDMVQAQFVEGYMEYQINIEWAVKQKFIASSLPQLHPFPLHFF